MLDLKQFRKENKITQIQLAEYLSVTQGFISQIEKGVSQLPEIYISKILEEGIYKLPENYSINDRKDLLSIGEYKIPNDGTYRLIPLINSDAVGGMHKMNDISLADPEFIKGYIPFTDALEEDLCIPVTSDSMIPTCPPGCVVQIRQVEDWREYFGYGNLFVIQLKDGRRIIKEVTRCDTNPKDYILCISHNKSVPPEELPKNFIVSVWKVIKVLTDRGW
ncbi:XRE family transcriptional regulator [uncultured Dysgonomonas sp.]|uniref:HTH cro/C1-type domain-containing protein n=1 Tax=uncultured Dysgonomonas sp. TaxID=206096 RepID=A0A212K1Q4_9BACT|nr:XRE family transcriptional regulator [uncultured Dysgonomonas sp.]SBW05603.1 conserved hypothetical protein [uncultured Dysgonomonas sp.]